MVSKNRLIKAFHVFIMNLFIVSVIVFPPRIL